MQKLNGIRRFTSEIFGTLEEMGDENKTVRFAYDILDAASDFSEDESASFGKVLEETGKIMKGGENVDRGRDALRRLALLVLASPKESAAPAGASDEFFRRASAARNRLRASAEEIIDVLGAGLRTVE